MQQATIQIVRPASPSAAAPQRWEVAQIEALFELPFNELLYQAQTVHRANFDPAEVQLSTLLSIKTGGCAENCSYCPQSSAYDTGVEATALMKVDAVLEAARAAQAAGATRFCMGAAWRGPKDRDIEKVSALISAVKGLGLETCATLGMLGDGHAETLRDAGLDYYNHNIDSAPDKYADIVQTRQFEDRIDTLQRVRGAGVKVCCGGIVGMGESRTQRAALIGRRVFQHRRKVPLRLLIPERLLFLSDEVPVGPVHRRRRIRGRHRLGRRR